jgi:hypothetical protein
MAMAIKRGGWATTSAVAKTSIHRNSRVGIVGGGLLIEVGEWQFEFSHAALQEYLAADAMVWGSNSVLDRWRTTFPALAAVTVAISSDANRWLHDLVRKMPANLDDVGPLAAFLDRLGQERPRFHRSGELGNGLLLLAWRAHLTTPDSLHDYTNLKVGSANTRAARYEGVHWHPPLCSSFRQR